MLVQEVKAKEQMAELKVEIANLSRLLEQGAAGAKPTCDYRLNS